VRRPAGGPGGVFRGLRLRDATSAAAAAAHLHVVVYTRVEEY